MSITNVYQTFRQSQTFKINVIDRQKSTDNRSDNFARNENNRGNHKKVTKQSTDKHAKFIENQLKSNSNGSLNRTKSTHQSSETKNSAILLRTHSENKKPLKLCYNISKITLNNSKKKVKFSNNVSILKFNRGSPPQEISKNKNELLPKKKRSRKRKPNAISANRFFPQIANQEIHILSEKYQPTPLEKAVLSLGLNFIPTPALSTKEAMLKEFDEFANSLRRRKRLLKSRIDPTVCTNNIYIALRKLKIKNPTNTLMESPLPANSPLENFLAISRFSLSEMLDKSTKQIKSNRASNQIRKALLSLKRNKGIVIKPSYKNLGVCIMDVDFYMNECYRQLNDETAYTKYTTHPNYNGIFATLRRILFTHNFLYNKDNSLTYLAKFLLRPQIMKEFKIGKFYILPKIHKPKFSGRPIVNCIETFTSFTSRLVDKLLQPIMKSFRTFIQDSNELILHLDSMKFQKDVVFFTADVVNLYPLIDINAGLTELTEALNLHNTPNSDFIIKLAKWTLNNNYFTFDNKIFKQTKGVAMGQSIAVSFACIYMSMLEMKCFKKCKSLRPSFQFPLYFKRYIDDIFSIWKSRSDAEFFNSEMNKKMHPNIELTSTFSNFSCIFLDVQIFKGSSFAHSGLLDVVLYQKPINKYQYIPYTSFHTRHVFKSFISSELNRYICKCTSPHDFLSIKRQFYTRLIRRGYPDSFLKPIFDNFPSDVAKLEECRKNKLKLLQESYMARKNNEMVEEFPLIYMTIYNPIHEQVNLHKVIIPSEDSPIHFDPDWPELSNRKNPILCFKNNKRLGGFLL